MSPTPGTRAESHAALFGLRKGMRQAGLGHVAAEPTGPGTTWTQTGQRCSTDPEGSRGAVGEPGISETSAFRSARGIELKTSFSRARVSRIHWPDQRPVTFRIRSTLTWFFRSFGRPFESIWIQCRRRSIIPPPRS